MGILSFLFAKVSSSGCKIAWRRLLSIVIPTLVVLPADFWMAALYSGKKLADHSVRTWIDSYYHRSVLNYRPSQSVCCIIKFYLRIMLYQAWKASFQIIERESERHWALKKMTEVFLLGSWKFSKFFNLNEAPKCALYRVHVLISRYKIFHKFFDHPNYTHEVNKHWNFLQAPIAFWVRSNHKNS